jgi:ubiquinone/menaquinone biosynthesis C-methylase UbiE
MSEGSPLKADTVRQFFVSQWSVYERMVKGNLLCHQELFNALRDDLLGLPTHFSLLDLASGDAGSLAKALAGMRVSRCVAVDLAGGPVLLAARDNLRFRGIPAEVKQAEFLEFVSTPPKRAFDVVTLSYSLHHLATADKERFFQGVARWVKPGGGLWLIDELLPAGMGRAEWLPLMLERLHRVGAEIYSPEEWAEVDGHITTSDFPESAETYGRMAREAGFANAATRLLVGDGLLGMMRFTR